MWVMPYLVRPIQPARTTTANYTRCGRNQDLVWLWRSAETPAAKSSAKEPCCKCCAEYIHKVTSVLCVRSFVMASTDTPSLHLYFLLETGNTEAERDPGAFCASGYFSLRNLIQWQTPPVSAPALIQKLVDCSRQKTRFFDGVGTKTSSNLLLKCFYFPIRIWLQATGYGMSEWRVLSTVFLIGLTIILQKIRLSVFGWPHKVAKKGIAWAAFTSY